MCSREDVSSFVASLRAHLRRPLDATTLAQIEDLCTEFERTTLDREDTEVLLDALETLQDRLDSVLRDRVELARTVIRLRNKINLLTSRLTRIEDRLTAQDRQLQELQTSHRKEVSNVHGSPVTHVTQLTTSPLQRQAVMLGQLAFSLDAMARRQLGIDRHDSRGSHTFAQLRKLHRRSELTDDEAHSLEVLEARMAQHGVRPLQAVFTQKTLKDQRAGVAHGHSLEFVDITADQLKAAVDELELSPGQLWPFIDMMFALRG